MNRSAILLFLPLLAGCDVHSKNPADSDGNVIIQADDSGHIAFNLPIAEGKLKIPGAMMHNGDIDIDGVKLMPGSSVTGFSVFAGDKGATVNLGFSAPAKPDEVRSYYIERFHNNGMEAALAGEAVTGKTKDGNPFTIHVGPGPNGSQGKIEFVDRN
ncbi:MAG TPA: hypothetical protein VFI88_01395 [Sphingomicrobium sp.]|jgi:hypothetical protein|nr:hypothetical protein [Sphingomicrobium sp.]